MSRLKSGGQDEDKSQDSSQTQQVKTKRDKISGALQAKTSILSTKRWLTTMQIEFSIFPLYN